MNSFFTTYQYYLSLKPEQPPKVKGFRNCQMGAIWAVKSHFTASNDRALVSLPTGAGKTAVMMALAFELGARRVFILTPYALVREQTARAFETLDQLFDDIEALPRHLKTKAKPAVSEVVNNLTTQKQWKNLLQFDVVVATPNVVRLSDAPPEIFGSGNGAKAGFDLVFVDEAHHSPAKTWTRILNSLKEQRTVLFTATPFRRDRKRIRAKPVYVYPISRAIQDGIYSKVRFVPVEEDDPRRLDAQLAAVCKSHFFREKKKNPDMAVIIKARGINHAEDLLTIYEKAGFKNRLGIIHSERSLSQNRQVLSRVLNKNGKKNPDQLDGFVCVDMGSEGIDVPNLRMAVFHDTPQTLPYTIQILGRVTRKSLRYTGEAVLIANPNLAKGSEVQDLYESDEGWSSLLPKFFDRYYDRSKFLPLAGSIFRGVRALPAEDLNPYLTVRVYQRSRKASRDAEFFHSNPVELDLGDKEIDWEIFKHGKLLLIITRVLEVPRWTTHRGLETERFDLHIYYVLKSLVFESTTSERIAGMIRSKIVDEESFPRADYHVIRSGLSDAAGGHFFMVGLARQSSGDNTTPQYKTLLGEDVQQAVRLADGRSFGPGHAMMKKNGTTRGIAIQSSRIWSNTRKSLEEFQAWCDDLVKLFISGTNQPIPEIENKLMTARAITNYPENEEIISVLFDNELWRTNEAQILIDSQPILQPVCYFDNWSLDKSEEKVSVDLMISQQNGGKPPLSIRLEHRLRPPYWTVKNSSPDVLVKIDFDNEKTYANTLGEYVKEFPPQIILASGATIRKAVLFIPKIQNQRIDPDIVVEKDWSQTDLTKEAKPPGAGYRWNVQERTRELIREQNYLHDEDFLICDDRANEVADFVLIQGGLLKKISFFHCKYKISKTSGPGFAREDISELIDQGVRTGNWIRAATLLTRLESRLGGSSQLIHGNLKAFQDLAASFSPTEWTYAVCLVQPGISRKILLARKAPSQTEQLLIVACDRTLADYGANFTVWTSP